MSDSNALDPILKGRSADPAVREGIALVEYPEYLIAETLDGNGLRDVYNRIDSESLTPEAAAQAITDMIAERLTEDIPEEDIDSPRQERGRVSFIPGLSAKFPQPVVSKIFGKKTPVREEPVFTDDASPIDFDSPVVASLLMRTEAVTRLWRHGKMDAGRAAHLLEVAVSDYQARQRRN